MAITQKFPKTKASAVDTEEGLTVQDIVSPFVKEPTFTKPTAEENHANEAEVGTLVSAQVKFTKNDSGGIDTSGTFGSIALSGGTTGTLTKSNVTNSSTDATDIVTYTPAVKAVLGTISLTYGGVPYLAGTGTKQYTVNNVAVDKVKSNDITAGSVTPQKASIIGYYKYFIGFLTENKTASSITASEIRGLVNNGLLKIAASASATFTSAILPANTKAIVIAVPDGYTVTNVTYNSSPQQEGWLDQFGIQAADFANMEDAAGATVAYKLYIYNNETATGFSGGNTLNVTIKRG